MYLKFNFEKFTFLKLENPSSGSKVLAAALLLSRGSDSSKCISMLKHIQDPGTGSSDDANIYDLDTFEPFKSTKTIDNNEIFT